MGKKRVQKCRRIGLTQWKPAAFTYKQLRLCIFEIVASFVKNSYVSEGSQSQNPDHLDKKAGYRSHLLSAMAESLRISPLRRHDKTAWKDDNGRKVLFVGFEQLRVGLRGLEV
jgi:hypothetical protein